MQDQVSALKQFGVRAEFLNSTLSWPEQCAILDALASQKLDLLYLAPERLLQEETLDRLDRVELALIAIDEAHCVSQWGHDFRQDYLGLNVLAERFPDVPRMALTATADRLTRREILSRLELDGAEQFISGFDRPNIRYTVRAKTDANAQLLAFLRERQDQAGIVYAMTRKKVETLAGLLKERGFTALPYHAGLPTETRNAHQARFQYEDGVVVVATIAFGMGIDKPDVRFVAHVDLPKSVEAYYQETGRARPRRGALRGVDGLRPPGRGPPAPAGRSIRSGRGTQAHRADETRRAAGLVRSHRLPAAGRCWSTSETASRTIAATAISAFRPPKPGTAQWKHRNCCPVSTVPASASAPRT